MFKCKYYPSELLIALFVITHNIASIACFSKIGWMSRACSISQLCIWVLLILFCERIHVSKNKTIYMSVCLTIFFVIYLYARTLAFVFAIVLYFTCEKTRFEKIMDLIWKAYFALIILAFLLYFGGISDGGIARTYDVTRQAKAFGFSHPNVGGYWIAMMLLSKMYCDEYKKIKIGTIKGILNGIFYVGSLLGGFYILKCRTSVAVVGIGLLCMLFYKNIKFENTILRIVTELVQPAILLFTVIGAIVYPAYGIKFLDMKLANRIFLCHYHYIMNGFSLFGKTIDYSKYTLDNSYMSFLLQYGIGAMLIYALLSIATIKKAWKNKNGAIIAVAVAIFAYGYMENGIFDPTANFAFLYLLTGNIARVKNGTYMFKVKEETIG